MAIGVRGSAESSAINGGNVTVTHPAGLATGDFCLVTGGNSSPDTNGGNLTFLTSGYTELANISISGAPALHDPPVAFDNSELLSGWKIQGGTPDSTVVVANAAGGSDSTAVVEIVYTGVDQSTPIDATTTKAGGAFTQPDSTSITTATDGARVVSCVAGNVTDTAVTAPSGYGNQVDRNADDTRDITVGMADITVASHGAEDPPGWTNWTTAAMSWTAVTVAIRPASSGAFTIAADSVAWSWTATAVTIKQARKIVPDSLAWAWSVTDATLVRNLPIVPASVAWSWSATDVSLEHGRIVVPESLSWAWAATDVTLNKGLTLVPESLAWSWAAQDVSLEHGREIVPDSVAWSWTITDAALKQARTIVPDSVAWSYSVTDVSLERGFEIVPDSVAWTYSVTDASFLTASQKIIVPDSVAWSWAAQDVSLEQGRQITADAVDWTWTAGDVTFALTAAPSVTTGAPSYGGGYTRDDERRWRQAAERLIELERKLTEAPAEPELVQEAEEVIEAVEEATGLDVPIRAFDDKPIRAQIKALRAATIALMEKMHAEHMARERRRRNNNWLMLQ